MPVSASLTGLLEACIYAVCIGIQIHRMPLSTVTFACWVAAWIALTWLFRQSIDLKSMRDFIIPVLFISLGRYVGDVCFAERCLKLIVGIVIVMGLFELAFLDTYAQLFNTFSFYVNLGGINENAAMFEGQMLTLNGYRPEGVGRTLFPFLLGPHRVSSVLMEPVSLGNFAVIVLAWALSKPWAEMRKAAFFFWSAALLIVLCDSRFGMMMALALVAFRCVPDDLRNKLSPTIPFAILAVIIAIALVYTVGGDNFLGRVTFSGNQLLRFDWKLLLGVHSPLPNYGDVGYAYVISRFGVPLSIVCVAALFLVPMGNRQGERFRSLIVLYMFSILAISGTSIFALKTAGLMWFLFGVLAANAATAGNRSLPEAGVRA